MVVCTCGQVIHTETSQNKTVRMLPVNSFLVLFAFLVVGAFIHAVNWDAYFFEIIPLKGKQILGMADAKDLGRINVICRERKKLFCQEQALSSYLALQPKDAAASRELASLQMGRDAFGEAVQTLQKHVSYHKKDRLARFQLAESLTKLGRTREAKEQLHYLVFSSKRKLDPAPARLYVSLLLHEKNFKAARRVIQHCRRMGPNASLFLEKEWRMIQHKPERKVAGRRGQV